MNFLLDTNTISYYFKGNAGVVSKFKEIGPARIRIPAVTIYEIEYGISKSANREKKGKQFAALLSVCGIVNFGQREAAAAADIRVKLERAGNPIGPYDILIAASAVAHGYTLVTHNVAEFRRVTGLRIVDWFKA